MTTRIRSRPRKLLRAVLDTNVVLSALVFSNGATAQLRGAWQRRDFAPLISTATAQELIRVLAYPKFKLDAEAQRELLTDYLSYALVVSVLDPPPKVPACRDRCDLPFLHLAVAGKADVLITGDIDLLVLAGKVKYAIMPTEAFLKTLLLPLA